MPEERNPVAVICHWVEDAMAEGEIPAGNAALVAGAIIGVIVQNATFRLYGRLAEGLAAHADEIVSICLRIVS